MSASIVLVGLVFFLSNIISYRVGESAGMEHARKFIANMAKAVAEEDEEDEEDE